MSIQVNAVTKTYGTQLALNNISFELNAGEVVGFLGPNGAGKSTMMKIITCYIPPTIGTVNVCGFDVMDNSIAVKRLVGYLPEHNPLYLDMYVKEYLEFTAGMYGINKALPKLVASLIDRVGLGVEQHKKIGQLSKGYRQRVGLAQAMIHDPKVLILDEPTTGLDPNQIVDIRNLIKEIGKEKTVMLSSHIMQEVEAICNRVIIINNGQIVANDNAQNLARNVTYRQVVVVEFDKSTSNEQLKKLEGVGVVENIKPNVYKLFSTSDDDLRVTLFNYAVANSLTILAQHLDEQSLEQVFQKLTRK
ncbi:MAG: gliding motility-associated ABC transporter ATP-binding subunit GldA [Bacteroidia bacterium]|nr:gliding motility-associated ABC transporter ATP-binding subunit GldA [Bacteroidia bacterium]